MIPSYDASSMIKCKIINTPALSHQIQHQAQPDSWECLQRQLQVPQAQERPGRHLPHHLLCLPLSYILKM
jgi:hypothetical protein